MIRPIIIFTIILALGACAGSPDNTAEISEETPFLVSYPAENPDIYSAGDDWTLAWSDEFDGEALDENIWTRQVMLHPYNNEWQQYTGKPETAYVEDGYMVIAAAMKGSSYNMGQYTSARVISNPGGQNGKSEAEGKTFLYGKIAARIQLPYGEGIWPAFWMLGDNISETGGDTPWPVAGEIDILEAGSKYEPDFGQGTVSGALHHDPSPGNKKKVNEFMVAGKKTLADGEFLAEEFHVYEIEWNEDEIIWFFDGNEFGRVSISEETRDEFHKEFYAIFNIAVGGHFTVQPGPQTPFPQYMYVDWVRHYTK